MIPLFSTKQIREADSFAINTLGIPGIVLMENASICIVDILKENFPLESGSITGIICGKGNNGGDGFAAARHLSNQGYKVFILHLGTESEMSGDCLYNYRIIKALSRENENIILKKYNTTNDLKRLKNCSVILDAILGSGAAGALKEPYGKIVEALNSIKAFKAAVDIPTGLDADKGYGEIIFKSDLTITLGELKKGLFFGDGYGSCGKIEKADIGIGYSFFEKFPVSEYLIEPEDVFNSLPQKKKSIHKYSAGKVLTIGGSADLPGAAAMTSMAAMKIGAGASIVAFPKSARELIHKELDEVIVNSYEDDSKGYLCMKNVPDLEEKIKWADTLAIGPGLGREEETQKAIIKILKEKNFRNIVIDADAIFAIGKFNYKRLDLKNMVLTPHHGEFSGLVGIKTSELKKDILGFGKQFVNDTKAYLVLKGAPTIIFLPDGESLINTSGNPGLAKFGTGDVLTGILAGLLAQEKDIEKSLVCGVYLHSLAADLLSAEYSEFSYTATDIIGEIPSAINFLRNTFAKISRET
ncbi:MAG TPA: NAD(P)H-hydrate dehydratase [Ignavibacteriaceae bacterium]|nr:NAD(P)H-hydrate dehydratase [Ignavibacteriaceae bacterium]